MRSERASKRGADLNGRNGLDDRFAVKQGGVYPGEKNRRDLCAVLLDFERGAAGQNEVGAIGRGTALRNFSEESL